MSTRPDHHPDLLARSNDAMIAALGELCLVSEAMVALLRSRRAEIWAPGEARRYAELRGRELRAHRRYLASQRWHDAVRRRVLENAVPF
ncbi:MAG TPA: hypothetical protein VGR20_05025 [Acidimicrobiia bacterium]|nr:hypothetical protein [Acidimicrobiia bacterium]